jgi:DHA3 family tetracycline resistance protein-like MFS transporter
VLLVIFVSAAVEALVQPSRQAAIPLLVPAADVEAANGLVLALTTAAGAVGFGLAGILVLALPSPLWLFACDAATFALAGALVFSVGNIGGETPGVSLRSGFRRAFSGDARPYLFIAIVGALVIPLGVPILLPYAYELSRDGAQTFGVLEIALLAGAVAGSLAVSRIARVGSARAMAGGMALTGVAAIAMAASTALLPALIAAFFSTVGNATYVIANQSATVRAAPPSERGRVMATRFSVTQACSIAALAAGGALAVAVGAHATYLIVGGALLLAALAPLVLRRRSARFAS